MRIRCLISLLSAALVAFATAAAAGPLDPILRELSPSSLRIVGGAQTTIEEWPWQVFLEIPTFEKDKFHLCGGSLIARRWVLTAAHCFPEDYDKSKSIFVVEGMSYYSKDGGQTATFKQVHEVQTLITHDYDPATNANDIALLPLQEDAESKPISPLMASDPGLEAPPQEGVATGWGVLNQLGVGKDGRLVDYKTKIPVAPGGLNFPHHLMKVNLPLIDLAQCKELNRDVGIVTDSNICAGPLVGGKDTCKGDSGGPLTALNSDGKFVQIGIISWGQGCGEPNHPGVYTRVSSFAGWLKSVVGSDLVAPTSPTPQTTPAALYPDYDNGSGVDVQMVGIEDGKQESLDVDAVKMGQQVAIVVTTQKPGYLVLLDEGPDGKLTQVFPNVRSLSSPTGVHVGANMLAPGKPLIVPDPRNPYAGFIYLIDKTPGAGMITAFVSDRPLTSVDLGTDGLETFATAKEARTYLSRVAAELSTKFLPTAGSTEPPTYSAAYLSYNVK